MCICRAEVAPPNKKLLFSQPKKKKKLLGKSDLFNISFCEDYWDSLL